jgi:beta-N-acetylhexosaminidase
MGQLFMMGFDGTEVNPQIRSLIENYHLGAVLLSAKNLKCIDTPRRVSGKKREKKKKNCN